MAVQLEFAVLSNDEQAQELAKRQVATVAPVVEVSSATLKRSKENKQNLMKMDEFVHDGTKENAIKEHELIETIKKETNETTVGNNQNLTEEDV